MSIDASIVINLLCLQFKVLEYGTDGAVLEISIEIKSDNIFECVKKSYDA